MEEKYFIGYDENGNTDVFQSTQYDATLEKTGFSKIVGPFDTLKEAEEALD